MYNNNIPTLTLYLNEHIDIEFIHEVDRESYWNARGDQYDQGIHIGSDCMIMHVLKIEDCRHYYMVGMNLGKDVESWGYFSCTLKSDPPDYWEKRLEQMMNILEPKEPELEYPQ